MRHSIPHRISAPLSHPPHQMRTLFSVLATIILVGCASTPVPLTIDNIDSSANTKVEDLRPATEGTREIFSLLITSDQYGFHRLAQDLTEPTGPRLFAHMLQEKHGKNPVPRTKLHHFVVYMNMRAELKKVALGAALGGMIGAAIANDTIIRDGETSHTLVNPESFAALSGENEYKRALYTEAELKEGTSAIVVFIDSDTEGVRRFTRTVSPMKQVQQGQKSPLHQALDSAIRFHLNP
ncbi:hypothetical protein [Inhella proteolytica]|uniref:Lipoprotein n=1 Tax=Inhella proteolytica TaxID=2795029 RepID=A0A931J433_9BURK|nr:hypothetical protein [Inhella proteolytica]MBH9575932.1 hypothetical protein [Inhella proteolytica]